VLSQPPSLWVFPVITFGLSLLVAASPHASLAGKETTWILGDLFRDQPQLSAFQM